MNHYNITAFKTFIRNKKSSLTGDYQFGIKIRFSRNSEGILGIVMSYHLICAILVLLASINFLFEPRDTNRSCMLVALILVLATFFSDAQVKIIIKLLQRLKILVGYTFYIFEIPG